MGAAEAVSHRGAIDVGSPLPYVARCFEFVSTH
jgi:hypothetical protein